MKSSNYRILIIDDHPVVQACLREYLNAQESFEVCGVTGEYREALVLLDDLKPDLAIVDISIEGGNGLNILKRAKTKKLAKGTRYLVLSAHDETVLAPHAYSAGAGGYINKQAPMEDMLGAVRQILNGGSCFPDFITDPDSKRSGSAYDDKLAELTARELEVFENLGHGKSSSEIAELLSLSIKTIDSHRENIKMKLDLHSANELLLHAVHWVMGKRPASS